MDNNEHIFEEPTEEEEEDKSLVHDEDTCTNLETIFKLKYKIQDESSVSLKKDYILNLGKDSAFTRIVAGLSNATVQIFDISSTHTLNHTAIDCISTPIGSTTNTNTICGVRFLDETPNCLLVGTTDGLVRLFDLRTQNEQARFEDTSDPTDGGNGEKKIITCFDRNANGRIICMGTEQYLNNVYLLFYDVRERKQLGGYCESHQDDITTINFHSQDPDLLCSGATDGLINIFNIKKTTEDDALTTTINTESSVHKLNWHKKDLISCITHTNDLKLYECEEGDLVAEFERPEITKSLKRKNPANFNLIDVHNMEDDGIFILAGTNFNKGEIMRSMVVQNKQLLPLADFDGNKQIIRDSLCDLKSNTIVTAGESGIVSLWRPEVLCNQQTSSGQLKAKKQKSVSHKMNPY